MEILPRDIESKKFAEAFRGYNREEVDEFLDEVEQAFDLAHRERDELRIRVGHLEKELDESRTAEGGLKRILVTAEKTADSVVSEAQHKAQTLLAQAERRAQEVLGTAERSARELLAQASTREQEVESSLEGLRRFEGDYRSRLKSFLESQLRVLTETVSQGPTGHQARPAPPGEETAGSRATTGPSGLREPQQTPPQSGSSQRHPSAQNSEAPGGSSQTTAENAPPRPEQTETSSSGESSGGAERSMKELFWGKD